MSYGRQPRFDKFKPDLDVFEWQRRRRRNDRRFIGAVVVVLLLCAAFILAALIWRGHAGKNPGRQEPTSVPAARAVFYGGHDEQT